MGDRGDRFERLYRAYSGLILGYALRRMASPQDAADVVAEVFLVTWRRLDDVPAGDDARLWLYGVARHVVTNLYRGERRRDRLAARVSSEVAAMVDALPADHTLDRPEIRHALDALPPTDRELLGLLGWEGLDAGQAAQVLGCTRATVRVRLHRARRRLARELLARGVDVPQHAVPPGHERPGWAIADPDKEDAQ